MTSAGLPGMRALAIARRWFDADTIANVFEPLVSDWQHEYVAAVTPRDRFKVQMSGWIALLRVLACTMPPWVGALPPKNLVSPIAIRALAFCSIATAVLIWPFVVQYSETASWQLWLYILPSSLVLPLAFVAMPLAQLLRELTDVTDHRARRLLVQMVAMLLLVCTLMLGWAVPAANQAWRSGIYAALTQNPISVPLMPGLRELSVPALFREIRLHGRPDTAQRELQSRAALAVSPVVLGAIGWVLGTRFLRRRAALAFVLWVTVTAGFFQLRVLGRAVEDAYALPAGAGMWVPHLIVALSLVLYSICQRAYRQTDRKHPPVARVAP